VLLVPGGLEEFVAQVYRDGRVTLPKQLRKRFDIKDGDYVRLVLVEVLKKGDAGEWVKRRVE
jgi:AbrB family looped-hinge helix DNA binding protein